jgi:hypothetical protein
LLTGCCCCRRLCRCLPRKKTLRSTEKYLAGTLWLSPCINSLWAQQSLEFCKKRKKAFPAFLAEIGLQKELCILNGCAHFICWFSFILMNAYCRFFLSHMPLLSLDMAITKVMSKLGSSFLHCLLPYSNILQYCDIFGPQWRRSEQALMHGKRNFLSILLDCTQVVHAGRQKCFWLCREKLVSFVVQTKKNCSESDADCVVRVLRSSILCCTKQNDFVLNWMQTVLLGFYLQVLSNLLEQFTNVLLEGTSHSPQDLPHIWLCQAQGYHMQIRSLKVLCQGVDWQSKSMYT